MAKGSRFIRSDFGIEVIAQTTQGTYVDPTNALCVEKGKATPPKIDIGSETITCADGEKKTILDSAVGSKVTFSIELALPTKSGKTDGVRALFNACFATDADDGSSTKQKW